MSRPSTAIQLIELHAHAPQKPVRGKPCNGCGVCCAAEPCSLATVVLRQHEGRCRALLWDERGYRYYCGLVVAPARYRPWLRPLTGVTELIFRRWIAADQGCDSDAEVVEQVSR